MLPERPVYAEYALADKGLELIVPAFTKFKVFELSGQDRLNVCGLHSLNDFGALEAIEVDSMSVLSVGFDDIVEYVFTGLLALAAVLLV